MTRLPGFRARCRVTPTGQFFGPKVLITHQPRRFAPEMYVAIGNPVRAAASTGSISVVIPGEQSAGSGIPPEDGTADRNTGVPIPRNDDLPLVRDAEADRWSGSTPHRHSPRNDSPYDGTDLGGPVLAPTRSREGYR